MITRQSLADYIQQYKELNPGCSEFDLVNHMFNQGFAYGRKKKPAQKFDNYGRSNKGIGY